MENIIDFDIRKFRTYNGPNYYLNKRAFVFNIFLDPEGPEVDFYKKTIYIELPKLANRNPSTVIDLLSSTLIYILKMEIELYPNDYSISEDGEDYVVAVEFIDKEITEECVNLVSEWFKAMNKNTGFDFHSRWTKIKSGFNKTLLGDTAIYSLVEAGIKRNIPVFYLKEEKQFQWGYGEKQLRGLSTSFHTDGSNDIELLANKNKVSDFLSMCGFPTIVGENNSSKMPECYLLTVNGKFSAALQKTSSDNGFINIAEKTHSKNIEIAESIAKFFNVKCLEIIVSTKDISKPWTDGNFHILKINTGKEIAKQLTSTNSKSVDLAGLIIKSHFRRPEFSRIPIIAGNYISQKMADSIYKKLRTTKPSVGFSSLTDEGIFFNGKYFSKSNDHEQNVKIILRFPETEFAVINHTAHDILDFGFFHEGADVVILDNANDAEGSMKNILLENGILINISNHQIEVTINNEVKSNISFYNDEDKDRLLMTALEPILKELIYKYE